MGIVIVTGLVVLVGLVLLSLRLRAARSSVRRSRSARRWSGSAGPRRVRAARPAAAAAGGGGVVAYGSQGGGPRSGGCEFCIG